MTWGREKIQTRARRAEFARVMGSDPTDDDFAMRLRNDSRRPLYWFCRAADHEVRAGERSEGPTRHDGWVWARRAEAAAFGMRPALERVLNPNYHNWRLNRPEDRDLPYVPYGFSPD